MITMNLDDVHGSRRTTTIIQSNTTAGPDLGKCFERDASKLRVNLRMWMIMPTPPLPLVTSADVGGIRPISRIRFFKSASGLHQTWECFSALPESNLLELDIDFADGAVPPYNIIGVFLANVPLLQAIRIFHEDGIGFLQPLIENPTLCPEIRKIRVCIDRRTCELNLGVVADLEHARKAVGRSILVGCIAAVEDEEEVSERWNVLCDEYRV